jgi:hypothetical protein
MLEPKWPAEPIELVAHVQAFTADTKFVQLKCRWCGTFAAARNELPITGPLFTEEVAP